MKEDKTTFEKASEKNQGSLISEYVEFLKENKKWWLIPILLCFLLFGVILMMAGSGAAPFIYTLF
jgi:hypothetical protein